MSIEELLAALTHALTVADVAQLLNISERQVYKLAPEHRMPCFKIGNSIRFDPAAFAAWLLQKMAPASEGPAAQAEDILNQRLVVWAE